MKNEKTSKRVSKIAGKILASMKDIGASGVIYVGASGESPKGRPIFVYTEACSAAELKSLAASALTQAPDKKRSK
jgi:hypothetical protein